MKFTVFGWLVIAASVLSLAAIAATAPEAKAYKQTFPLLSQGTDGEFVYIHAAIYAPIAITPTSGAAWVASPMALRKGGSYFIEAGWYRSLTVTACKKPYFCPYWSGISDDASNSNITWDLDTSNTYLNGSRPWFKIETSDCEEFHAYHGTAGTWRELTPPAGYSFAGNGFSQVISGVETDTGDLELKYGSDTNRWTENNQRRNTSATGCTQGAIGAWDYQGVSPNDFSATVSNLSTGEWRITTP